MKLIAMIKLPHIKSIHIVMTNVSMNFWAVLYAGYPIQIQHHDTRVAFGFSLLSKTVQRETLSLSALMFYSALSPNYYQMIAVSVQYSDECKLYKCQCVFYFSLSDRVRARCRITWSWSSL